MIARGDQVQGRQPMKLSADLKVDADPDMHAYSSIDLTE